ncbi:unnamed protein product, partial [Mesorhabditis belari]|uniref:C6 domain-containing protein n=1 Tax=Mesorhabditis belari TaxID=2138241 RepID=A0AAF3ENS1_9BILA
MPVPLPPVETTTLMPAPSPNPALTPDPVLLFTENTLPTSGCTMCSRKTPILDLESPSGMPSSSFSTDVFSINPSGCLVRSMICSEGELGTEPEVSFNKEVLGILKNAGEVKISLVCDQDSQWVFSMDGASAVITNIGCYT